MKKITVQLIRKDLKWLKKKPASFKHCKILIDENSVVCDETGTPIMYYLNYEGNTKNLEEVLKRLPYSQGTRTNGLGMNRKIIGYHPRNPLKENKCNIAAIEDKYPYEHQVIQDFATEIGAIYRKHAPVKYCKHLKLAKEMPAGKHYRIKDTPFTSGIVNKNSRIKYHYDTGNVKSMFSAMIALTNGIQGGDLICPEYRIGFKIKNCTVLLFDGQKILHGLTKLYKVHSNGYRYSIVYYTLQQMWKCLPPDEELLNYQISLSKIKSSN